jgi:multisubunit Na+/H+ antiporter MnhG subunit
MVELILQRISLVFLTSSRYALLVLRMTDLFVRMESMTCCGSHYVLCLLIGERSYMNR